MSESVEEVNGEIISGEQQVPEEGQFLDLDLRSHMMTVANSRLPRHSSISTSSEFTVRSGTVEARELGARGCARSRARARARS